MKKLLFPKHVLLFLVLFIVYSCSQEDELESPSFSNDCFVELSVVEEIANGIYFPTDSSSKLKSTKPETRTVSSIDEIINEISKTSYYIINYKEGGFIILSADNRVLPILAYSIHNNFVVDDNTNNTNLGFWMKDASNQIEKIQLSNREQSPEIEKVWARVQHSLINEVFSLKPEPPPDCYEHTEIFTIGPFDEPKWGQQLVYNNALPSITCNGSSFQVLVGCVPLAMAMVMKINEYPTSYTWSSMPLTGVGTTTTANFIEDIHDAINSENSTYPDYKCDVTLVHQDDVDAVLEDHFNYANSSTDNYNYNTVKTDLLNDKPVILLGWDGTDGHAWVCEGFRQSTYYYEDCSEVTTYPLFYMNWGSYGTNNGWYSYNNWNPGSSTWNDYKLMIHNITP